LILFLAFAVAVWFWWLALVSYRRRDDLKVKHGSFSNLVSTPSSIGGHTHGPEPLGRTPPVPLEPFTEGHKYQPDLASVSRNSKSMPGPILEAAPYGFLAGADVLESWSRVDEDTLLAVSQLTHQHISGLIDLRRAVDGHDYHLNSEHFQTMLRGHVGEQFAAGDFKRAGAQVDFYNNSNYPGADIQIDGHPANVKITADAGHAASEHFGSRSAKLAGCFCGDQLGPDDRFCGQCGLPVLSARCRLQTSWHGVIIRG
jgi:hypothetical protein